MNYMYTSIGNLAPLRFISSDQFIQKHQVFSIILENFFLIENTQALYKNTQPNTFSGVEVLML